MTSHNHLLVFLRAPRVGDVKSRLAAEIGPERALAMYRAMTEAIVRQTVEAPDATPEWEQILWVHPPGAEDEVRAWLPTEAEIRAQTGADLGARLAHAFAHAIDAGAGRVVVIGTDCPEVTAEVVAEAFAALEKSPVVMGPASDGGYYLIGMARYIPEVFAGIPWGTSAVYDATMRPLRRLDIEAAVLPTLSDIDTLDDLRAFTDKRLSGPLRRLAAQLHAILVGD